MLNPTLGRVFWLDVGVWTSRSALGAEVVVDESQWADSLDWSSHDF